MIFSFNFGYKKKALSDFPASRSSLKNSKYHEAGFKHINLNLQGSKLKISGFFREPLLSVLVFANESCCLCKCFTELYFFY